MDVFWSLCTKEMISVSLVGLLAKHRCVLAAAAGLVRRQEEIVCCAGVSNGQSRGSRPLAHGAPDSALMAWM